MRPPARVYRCEPPAGPPDLAPLTMAIRRHQATRPTPLENTMTPDPENAPLTPEEEAAHQSQGEAIGLYLKHERENKAATEVK